MNKEDSDYYDELFDMFATPGWKAYIDMQTHAFEHYEERARIDCPNNGAWQFRRGELDILFKIINFEEMIRNDYQHLEMTSELQVESNEYDPLH